MAEDEVEVAEVAKEDAMVVVREMVCAETVVEEEAAPETAEDPTEREGGSVEEEKVGGRGGVVVDRQG